MDSVIKIKVKLTSNAKVYDISIQKSDTIQKLKEECEKETTIPVSQQNLVFKGRILTNDKLVSDYGIDNDHTIILVKKHSPAEPKKEEKTEEKKETTNTTNTTNTSNTNTTNTNTTNTNANANNPFNMFAGGQMPDLTGMLGNIDPNELNNMMQGMGLGGIGSGLGGMNPGMMGQISQILNNPMYMQMMNNMLQDPNTLQMIMNSPQMQAMARNNPQLSAIMNNPQIMQQVLNPQNLQMMRNMMNAFGGLGANTNANNNNAGANNQQPPFDLNQMMQMMGGLGGMGGFGAGNNNVGVGNNNMGDSGNTGNDSNVDYKEKYKDQLAQLKDMGFINEETNIQVLKQCSGNVQFAVEKLLNMLG